MGQVVFLLEERSMEAFPEKFIPRFFPDLPFLCIAHNGKNDLEKRFPRKLRSWGDPSTRFVILRDNDNADCKALKAKLQALCRDGGREDALVRIVCQELEAWYLGDLDALADAFGHDHLRRLKRKTRYRNPDLIRKPSAEVKRLCPSFQKMEGARKMAIRLSIEANQSPSFKVFLNGLTQLIHGVTSIP